MNILIVGLGAVGTILSCYLNLNENDTVYAIKSKRENALEYKIDVDVIDSLKEKIKIEKNKVFIYNDEPIDIAFITLKSNNLPDIEPILMNLKNKNPKIISLMNGMGWEKYFNDFDNYYGIIMYNAFKNKDKIILGSGGGLILDKKLENILKDKIKTLPVLYANDIDAYRYRKLWLNTINGFLALFDFSLSRLFEESKNLNNVPLIIFKNYLEETKELYDRLSIKTEPLPSLDPLMLIDMIDKILNKKEFDEKELKLYKNLPEGKNSTLQSILRNEKTEYEFLGGYLVRLADKINLPYKINRFVYDKIKKYEENNSFDFFSLSEFINIMNY